MRPTTVLFLVLLGVHGCSMRPAPPSSSTRSVDDELAEFQRQFADAFAKRDREALERLHAPEFVWIHAFGSIETRQRRIEAIVAGEAPPLGDRAAPDEQLRYGDVIVHRWRARADPVLQALRILVRRDGRWQLAHLQGTLIASPRTSVDVDSATLDRYVGRYRFASGAMATVAREGEVLTWRGAVGARHRLGALSATRFFIPGTFSEITFVPGSDGRVEHVLFRRGYSDESRVTPVR